VDRTVSDFDEYTYQCTGISLRPYQTEFFSTFLDSIVFYKGYSFVLIVSRQAGKDECLTHLITWLLDMFSPYPASMVVINPTYKPQTISALDRLESNLSNNLLTRGRWRKRSDFMRFIGQAKVSFLSGDNRSNIVGTVGNLAIIVNEAQDILPATYDKKVEPMAASTNATKLFVGTVWTSRTLLAREMRNAQALEKEDGVKRLFMYNADDVRKIIPWYGDHVDAVVAKNGRQHPLIKTQYFAPGCLSNDFFSMMLSFHGT